VREKLPELFANRLYLRTSKDVSWRFNEAKNNSGTNSCGDS